MRYALILLLGAAVLTAQAQNVDRVLGVGAPTSWTGTGTDRVAAWGAAAPANWYDGLNLTEVWTLDDASGIAITGKVAGTVGTITGAAWSSASGVPALWFDGTNDVIECGDVLDVGTSNLLITAWLHTPGTGGSAYKGIVEKSDGSTLVRLLLTPGNGLYERLQIGATNAVRSSADNTVRTNEWIHVGYLFERASGYAALYTNGVVVSGAVATGPHTAIFNNAASFRIGSVSGFATPYYQGSMRDVAVAYGRTNGFCAVIYNASKSQYGK